MDRKKEIGSFGSSMREATNALKALGEQLGGIKKIGNIPDVPNFSKGGIVPMSLEEHRKTFGGCEPSKREQAYQDLKEYFGKMSTGREVSLDKIQQMLMDCANKGDIHGYKTIREHYNDVLKSARRKPDMPTDIFHVGDEFKRPIYFPIGESYYKAENCLVDSIEVEHDKLDHFSSIGGLRCPDRSILVRKETIVKIRCFGSIEPATEIKSGKELKDYTILELLEELNIRTQREVTLTS